MREHTHKPKIHNIQFCAVKNERKSSFLRPEMTFSDRFLVAPVKIRHTWFYPSDSQKDNFLTLPVDVLWKYVASAASEMVKNISIGHQMLSVTCFCRVLGVELDLRSKPPSQSLHNVEREKNSLAYLRNWEFFGAIYRLENRWSGHQIYLRPGSRCRCYSMQ